jgi:hypothetical protein
MLVDSDKELIKLMESALKEKDAELMGLRAALKKYGWHLDDCPAKTNYLQATHSLREECRCGFDESPTASLDSFKAQVRSEALEDVSATQKDILLHSLGREKNYRNYFAVDPLGDDWADIQRLVSLGLMKRGKEHGNLVYFHVTDKGRSIVGFPAPKPDGEGKE